MLYSEITVKTNRESAELIAYFLEEVCMEGGVIMDMGITKGVDVFVRKVAPLGDPVEVTVRGYELSLRKADAEMIEVE